ncbi:MAG: TetR/AcrR family transcriptional regulator [Nocardioidaceae bacterium]
MTTDTGVRRAGRAAPMPPDERRRAIVDAVVPLLLEHGRAGTTKQIAEGAGIAEGTIFRVFESKDELVDAALTSAFDPAPFLADLSRIDRDQPLEARLVELVTILQRRFMGIFALMRAVGMVAPPEHLGAHDKADSWRARVREILVDVVEPDAHRLRVAPHQLLHTLRLLTFSASHAEIADNELMTPEEIVDVVLHGMLARTDGPNTNREPTHLNGED